MRIKVCDVADQKSEDTNKDTVETRSTENIRNGREARGYFGTEG